MSKRISCHLVCALLYLPALLHAAQGTNPELERGEQIYQATCSNAYCHGVDGTESSAPALASRGFDETYIATVIRLGKENTTMAGFAGSLPDTDLNAVMSYVAALNGISNPEFPVLDFSGVTAGESDNLLSGTAALGKALFFDAYEKGLSRCSSCHEMEGQGVAVAPISAFPASVDGLRSLVTRNVGQLYLADRSLPVIQAASTLPDALFYDLTTVPPVLLTLPASILGSIANPADWQHANYIQAYSDTELLLVLDYLRTVNGDR